MVLLHLLLSNINISSELGHGVTRPQPQSSGETCPQKITSKGNLTAIQCKRCIRLCAIVHVTMVAKDALTYVDVGIATTAWVSQSR